MCAWLDCVSAHVDYCKFLFVCFPIEVLLLYRVGWIWEWLWVVQYMTVCVLFVMYLLCVFVVYVMYVYWMCDFWENFRYLTVLLVCVCVRIECAFGACVYSVFVVCMCVCVCLGWHGCSMWRFYLLCAFSVRLLCAQCTHTDTYTDTHTRAQHTPTHIKTHTKSTVKYLKFSQKSHIQ